MVEAVAEYVPSKEILELPQQEHVKATPLSGFVTEVEAVALTKESLIERQQELDRKLREFQDQLLETEVTPENAKELAQRYYKLTLGYAKNSRDALKFGDPTGLTSEEQNAIAQAEENYQIYLGLNNWIEIGMIRPVGRHMSVDIAAQAKAASKIARDDKEGDRHWELAAKYKEIGEVLDD